MKPSQLFAFFATLLVAVTFSLGAEAAPSVTSITPSSGPTKGGITITITGSGLTAPATISVGGAVCAAPATNGDTLATCTLPPGAGKGVPVVFTSGGASGKGTFDYTAPTIDSLTPTSGRAGSTITLTGSNFGPAATGSISLGGSTCTPLAFDHALARCTVPIGAGLAVPVVLDAAGQTSSTKTFDYLPPSITSVSPSGGPAAGNNTITVTGLGFGGAGAVTVGGGACSPVSSADTKIECRVPSGVGVVDVIVRSGGQSSAAAKYTYDAPSITGIAPDRGPTAGGTSLTIVGRDFGVAGAATVGGKACVAAVGATSDTRIICATPPGTAGVAGVVVTAGLQISNSKDFTYEGPSADAGPDAALDAGPDAAPDASPDVADSDAAEDATTTDAADASEADASGDAGAPDAGGDAPDPADATLDAPADAVPLDGGAPVDESTDSGCAVGSPRGSSLDALLLVPLAWLALRARRRTRGAPTA